METMIERLEKLSIAVLAHELIELKATGKNPHDFDADEALAVLVCHGIRPSLLGRDLDYLLSCAFRKVMRSAPNA